MPRSTDLADCVEWGVYTSVDSELLTKADMVLQQSSTDRRARSRPLTAFFRWVVLLLCSLAGAWLAHSTSHAAQEPELMPMPPTDELLQSVPEGLRPDLVLLKNEKGESVLVPKVRFEEFERFLKASSEVSTDSQAILETINLDLQIEESVARIRGTAKGRLTSPNRKWVSVPLALGAVQLLPPEDNSPFSIGLASVATGYQWRLEPSEILERSLSFQAVAKVQTTVQSSQVRLDLPTATAVVDLHLPEGEWDLNVTGAGSEVVEPIPGAAPFTHYRIRASGGSIDLIWTRRAASDNVQATEAISVTKFTQSPGSPKFDASSRITVRGPKRLGGRQFFLQLPKGGVAKQASGEVPPVAGYRLNSLGVNEEGLQSFHLMIDESVSRFELEFPLDWIWESTKVDSDNLFSIPLIEGVERHAGNVELVLPRSRTLLWDSQTGVEFNKRTVAPESNDLIQHSFRISDQSTSLRCRLLEPQITPSIRMDYRVWLFHDRWQLTGTLEFRDDPRGFPFLQLESKGWDVERITVASTGRELAFTDADAASGNNTIIPLSLSDWAEASDGVSGAVASTASTDGTPTRRIQLRMSYKIGSPTIEAQASAVPSPLGFELPVLTWLNESSQQRSAWSPSGNLSLFSSLASLAPTHVQTEGSRWSLTTVAAPTLEQALRDARMIHPREGIPRFSLGLQLRGDKAPTRCEFLSTPLVPYIEGTSTLRATALERSWKLEQDWLLQIRGTFPDHLLLAIPKSWIANTESATFTSAIDLNVNGVAITKVERLSAEEGLLWGDRYPSLKDHVEWTRIEIPQQVYLTATGDFTWLVTLGALRPPPRNPDEADSLKQIFAHLDSSNWKAPIRYGNPVGLIQSRPSTRVLLNTTVLNRSQTEIRIGEDLWTQTKLTFPLDAPWLDVTLVPEQNQISHSVNVERVWLQTITKPGTNRHRYVAKFRTSAPTLEIQLDAPLSEDVEAVLNHAPCELSLLASGQNSFRIDLSKAPRLSSGKEDPSGTDTENTFVLELFSWPTNPSSWWKRIEMPKVRLLNSNLDRAPCVWQLITPSSLHLISTSDSLLPDYRWSWNQVWMARQDSRSQSDLEKEMGASVQPDVGQQVNQYSLISLGEKEAVHATFVPRFLLWTPLALLTLTLSSLLLKNGSSRRALLMLVAIPLLAGLISWSLDITILVTQSMVVSCAILLIYAFVEWILDRNARKKSVFAGRGTFAGSVSGSRLDTRGETPSGSASKSVLTTIAPGGEVIAGGPVGGEVGSHGSRP